MKKALILSVLLAGSTAIGAGIAATAQDATTPPPPPVSDDAAPPPPPGMRGDHHGKRPMGPRLEDLDANKDGKITRDEIAAQEATRFSEIDANGDGFVTTAEMSAHHDAMREKERKEREAKMQASMLEKFDTDKDGKISKAEFTSKPMPHFDKIDANSDGVIDETEMAAAKAKMEKHKGKYKKMRGKFKEHRAERGDRD